MRGREDLPKGSEGSGGPRKGPRGVWRLYRRAERPFRRAGRRREAIPEGWEVLGGPPKGFGMGREALPKGREELGDPPEWPGGV